MNKKRERERDRDKDAMTTLSTVVKGRCSATPRIIQQRRKRADKDTEPNKRNYVRT